MFALMVCGGRGIAQKHTLGAGSLLHLWGHYCPLDLLARLEDFGASLAFESHISTDLLLTPPRCICDCSEGLGEHNGYIMQVIKNYRGYTHPSRQACT